MKAIFTLSLICILALSAWAQPRLSQNHLQARMWGEHNELPDYEAMREKYPDESAVTLFAGQIHEYHRTQNLRLETRQHVFHRRRILLLDHVNLERFSELTFGELGYDNSGNSGSFLGIRVIKQDGTERIVDLKNKTTLTVQEERGRRTPDEQNKYKIAIEDLEPGDIIDFFQVNINTFRQIDLNKHAINPVYIFLQEEFPVEKGKIEFLGHNGIYLNMKSMNGAPEPIRTSTENTYKYEIEYSGKDRIRGAHWSSLFRDVPHVKFQVILFPRMLESGRSYFIGREGIAKTRIIDREYEEMVNYLFKHRTNLRNQANRFARWHRRQSDVNHIAEDLFYFLRHQLYFTTINYYGYQVPTHYMYDEYDFINAFSIGLWRARVPYEIVVGMNKQMGTPGDALFFSELTFAIRVFIDDEPVYIFSPEVSCVFGQQHNQLEGTEAIAWQVERRGPTTRKNISIPLEPYPTNFQKDTLHISLAPGTRDTLHIRQKFQAGGMQKNIIGVMFSYFQEYSTDELANTHHLSNWVKRDIIMKRMRQERSHNKEKHDEQKDMISEWLKENHNISNVTIGEITILQTGRWKVAPNLTGEMSFSTPDLIQRAGDYLVVDVGSIIGKNVEFSDRDRERDTDIYSGFPREFSWLLRIDIPDGFEVGNPDDFNLHIENHTGGFFSSGKTDGNTFIIETRKYYTHSYEPVSHWPDLLQMLDLANEFERKKLVLMSVSAKL